MPILLITLIFVRPFICSLAFPALNYAYSTALLTLLLLWVSFKGLSTKLLFLRFPLLFFIISIILSIFFSKNKLTSFGEFYKYIGGLSLFAVAASFNKKWAEYIIKALILSGILISLAALYQYLFGFKSLLGYISEQKEIDPFVLDCIQRQRVFLPFVTANILGGYLAMIIPLCLARKRKILFIVPLSSALILTKSVGALLTLYLGLTLYFYLTTKLGKKEIILLLLILAAMGLIFTFRSAGTKEHIQPTFSTVARINYWLDTVNLITKYPLTGVGLGNFNLPQSRYAHNSYLQIWAEMGILGIISFLWLIIAILKSGLTNLKASLDKTRIAALITASAVFLLHNFIDFSFFLPEVNLLWWIILGILFSSPRQTSPTDTNLA